MSYIYNLTDTWNAAGTTFAGIKMAVTNTASGASSKLLDLSVSGATTGSFSVDKSGNANLSGALTLGTALSVANGGSGLNSLTAGYVPFGAGTSAFGSSANLTWDNSNARLSITGSFYNSGILLIGANTQRSIAGNLCEIQLERAAAVRAAFVRNTNDVAGPVVYLGKSRGTTTGSYTSVSSGDVVGTFNFMGADGTNDVGAVQVRAEIDGSPSTGVMPGRLLFATNGSAGGNPLERMRITSLGNVLIGTSASPTTGTQSLTIASGTAPTATPADTVTFYSVDRSAGNTIPAFYCEGAGVTNAGITNTTVTNKIAVNINGTVYFLLATTNAT